jgi:hypothetical protein
LKRVFLGFFQIFSFPAKKIAGKNSKLWHKKEVQKGKAKSAKDCQKQTIFAFLAKIFAPDRALKGKTAENTNTKRLKLFLLEKYLISFLVMYTEFFGVVSRKA